MPQRSGARVMGALTAVFLCAALFVSYRARTFHYCAGTGDRPQARVAGSAESCAPDEEPLEFERLGWPGKLRLAARAAAKAFGAN
ncbi:MAG: hypothetical protein ACLQU1_20775 [Bryobacteraceae bacterium]